MKYFNYYDPIKGKPPNIDEDDTVLFWISAQGDYSEITFVWWFSVVQDY